MKNKCMLLIGLLLLVPAGAGTVVAGTSTDTYLNLVRATIDGPDGTVAAGDPFTLTTTAERLSFGGLFWYLYEDVTWSYDADHGVVVTGGSQIAFDFWFSRKIDVVLHTITKSVPGTYKYTLVVSNAFAHSGRAVAVDYSVTVAEPIKPVDIDIKPQSCPNPLNVGSGGVVSVAILGSADFDVADVGASTVTLAGVSALRWNTEDVASPVTNRIYPCECTSEGADGFTDLVLKFEKKDLVAAIGPVDDGDEITLALEGELEDGGAIEGSDCMTIRKKKNKKK